MDSSTIPHSSPPIIVDKSTTGIDIRSFAARDFTECLKELDSSTKGLSNGAVTARRTRWGRNVIDYQKSPTWIVQLFRSFIFPFNAVLAGIALVSYASDVMFREAPEREYMTLTMLGIMILLSSLIRFWQEFRSNKAADALRLMVRSSVTVERQTSGTIDIDISEVVPGDIVHLAAGDMIPADCRVIRSKDLFVSQSLLTGESLPVEKSSAIDPNAADRALIELVNIVFMGTNVASGSATVVVVTTGARTTFAAVSTSIGKTNHQTSFDQGVNSVSYLLMRFMLVMVPLVFIINGVTKGDWFEALLFAISVAVGLTPEMLPMIVTTNLARGAITMSRKKVIVKRLNAIQNIGAMDVLCTDKTGTLTLDKIVLKRHLNVYGEEDDEVLQWAFLNSYHQTGLRNLLDKAVLEHEEVISSLHADKAFEKIDEIPFDFQRRRMSVVLRQPNSKHLLICKGAVEEMLDICDRAFDLGEDRRLQIDHDTVIPLDATIRESIVSTSRALNEDGLRVLLIAVREFDERELTYSVADESRLIVVGFIGFLDPAKPSAEQSIAALQELGVRVKVLTGDNEVVSRKICRDVGIDVQDIMMGHELEKISDEDLCKRIENISIFAKLSPQQKSRIIRALQSLGHTVGYMGDGINDAAALSDADVGISVDTAVDIAKESADIIMLEKDLMVLKSGVIYGRRTFGNIIKYIKMAASSNFGNMFSMLGASAALPFLPMQPIQILFQNLLYDISQISIPWDEMDEEYLLKPRRWDASGIARFMLFIGPISSLFDYLTFALMYYFFHAQTVAQQSLFQSGWFVESMISQSMIVHLIRTRKVPFVQSRASTPVLVLSGAIVLFALYVPYSAFAPALKMQALPLSYFPWLVLILVGYALLTQRIKTWYIGRFQHWL